MPVQNVVEIHSEAVEAFVSECGGPCSEKKSEQEELFVMAGELFPEKKLVVLIDRVIPPIPLQVGPS